MFEIIFVFMEKLLVKYWAGWINAENMQSPDGATWLKAWKERAEKEADEGNELLVFRVPKSKNMASEIERFLQEKLGK